MKIRALWTRCDVNTLRNIDWFMDTVLFPGGYTHWVAGLFYHFQCVGREGNGPCAGGPRMPLEREQLIKMVRCVVARGVGIIPQIGLWGYNPITGVHPELAENKAVPKSCCPRNPAVQTLVKDMIDEIIDLLHPEYFHVGLDEINENHMPYNNYKLADQIGLCPLCRMDSPADIFAEEVNRLNRYLKEKGCKMMIWGDQLLNPPDYFDVYKREGNYGDYTHEALNKMDKDILICDWHYGEHSAYPSVDHFMRNGFKALGCPSAMNVNNIIGFTDYIRKMQPNALLPGMIMTFWGRMSKRAEEKEDYKYGFIDDKVVVERLLMAGQAFRK